MSRGPLKGDGPLGLDGTTLMLLGGFVLGFGSMVLILIGGVGGPPIFVYLCFPTAIVPSIVALAWGVQVYRAERHLQAFAEWLKAHRREKMDELARRYGASRYEFERLLGKAIDRGLVKAVVDRAADEYVSKEDAEPTVFVGKCPWCGGEVNQWAFPEERFTCPYCERAVTAPAES